jgi:serine/threonine-protein kinase
MRKFVLRHRVPVIAGAAAAMLLIGNSAVALRQSAEARRQSVAAQQEAERARQQAKRAEAVQKFLMGIYAMSSGAQPDPQAARRTTARELLDRGAAKVEEALRDVPQAHAEVLGQLSEIYVTLAEKSGHRAGPPAGRGHSPLRPPGPAAGGRADPVRGDAGQLRGHER